MTTCPLDHRSLVGNAKICKKCAQETRSRLAEIPVLYIEAGAYLVPGKGGFGSSGSERTIGLNLAALGFRQAAEILGVLEDFERTVRVQSLGQIEFEGQEREDIPRPKNWRPSEEDLAREKPPVRKGTIQERVEGVCMFLLKHAEWLTCHDEAQFWVEEVAKIHSQGETATRRFTEKMTRIKCPTSIEEFAEGGEEILYRYCGETLTLGKDPLERVECKRCHTEWTTLFLVRVALETPSEPMWMDSDAIASLLGITSGQVVRISKADKKSKRGSRGNETYDLQKILQLRRKAI